MRNRWSDRLSQGGEVCRSWHLIRIQVRWSTAPVQLGLNSLLCVANLAGESGWSKSSAGSLDADRSPAQASIESRSAIWSDPIAMASRRFDSRAEIRDDNCGSLRQM